MRRATVLLACFVAAFGATAQAVHQPDANYAGLAKRAAVLEQQQQQIPEPGLPAVVAQPALSLWRLPQRTFQHGAAHHLAREVYMKIAMTIGICLVCLASPAIVSAQAISNGQPFTITIAADNSEVKAGSNVCVRVSITNNSTQDIALGGGAGGYTNLDPNYRFEVRDQSGNLAQQKTYPHPELFRPKLYQYALKPNETHTQDQCVSALYNMSKPGSYTIQAFRPASSVNPQAGQTISNVVTVTVIPAAPGGQPPSSIVIASLEPVFNAGSDVCIGISLTNSSSQNLGSGYTSVNGLTNEFRFEVHNQSGNLLPKKTALYPPPASYEAAVGDGLKPTDTEVSQVCPSKRYDMNTPGNYTIQVFRGVPKDGEISSNIITVTVVP